VTGSFNLPLDLGDASPGILSIEAAATYRGRRDARRLGVCLTRIAAGDGRTERDLALAEDYATHLRKSDAAEWIGALIETTEGRSPEDDRPFQLSRGPHSRRVEEWLGSHVGSYDLVLAHGIPFSHAVAAGEAARAAGVPYVVLPHYHMDDRYYHWQSYFELVRGAELTLAAPDRSLPLFFDRIGARAVAVAGGGFDRASSPTSPPTGGPSAPCTIRHAVRARARPQGGEQGLPSGHCGGRSSGARGIDCEVVLIGPDSDSLPIESAAARYFANQPRSVVLGALAECACLATMSESESFGIVLVEAWACGKPVIANRACPAFAELIDDGRDGFLCGSEDEIANTVGRLLAEPETAARLGAAGKAKAFARYTWERMAEAIEQALLTAAEHTRPSDSEASTDRCTATNASAFP
jgi:glycosyltransferase involved in cell wall biosynthesis